MPQFSNTDRANCPPKKIHPIESGIQIAISTYGKKYYFAHIIRTIIGAFYIILESNILTHTYFKSLPLPLLYDKAAVKTKLAKAGFLLLSPPPPRRADPVQGHICVNAKKGPIDTRYRSRCPLPNFSEIYEQCGYHKRIGNADGSRITELDAVCLLCRSLKNPGYR